MPLLLGLQFDEVGPTVVVTGRGDLPSVAASSSTGLRNRQPEGTGDSTDATICYNQGVRSRGPYQRTDVVVGCTLFGGQPPRGCAEAANS